MKPFLRRLRVLAAALAAGATAASAQTFPLELRNDATLYNTTFARGINLSSQRGVPISSTAGTPAGSDGRAPNAQQQSLDGLPITSPTPGQYLAFGSFGAIAAPRTATLLSGSNYVGNAIALDLPRGMNASGQVVAVLRSAQVAGSWFSRLPSLQFGGIIQPPETDESGLLLSQRGIRPEEYWLPEPHSTNSHVGAAYYWSRHAQQVFAVQTGPIEVQWKRAQASAAQPQDYSSNPSAYVLQSGFYYRINPTRYVVSGSPVKAPKRLYWTEGNYRTLGKPVVVPNARVGGVNIVYNNNLPSRVDREVVEAGQIPIVETNRLEETRTIWYDQSQGQIFAYNREGRVFVELLGDRREDGVSRQFLGFEIVDVVRQAQPSDVAVEIGDVIHPGSDVADPGSLRAEPVLQSGTATYLFRHVIVGSDNVRFFAVRETENLNDQLVYWMQAGEVGLFWPDRLVRYDFNWPTDPARYSHYVRPEVATEAEAKLTAVQLPLSNGPAIEYQDPLDVPRGKLTERFEYYTFLNRANPVHRALLRFTAGDEIAFERVYSWLDAAVVDPGLVANTTATNLAGWYPNNRSFGWTNLSVVPRIVQTTVSVGDRIPAPAGEIGATGTNYLAGHIRSEKGTSYHPGAYVNPFTEGFDEANKGAIIPVNAIPGADRLEVWWFRRNQPDLTRGFGYVNWPAVIGRYTLQWPSGGSEIVLASNAGSGDLPSLAARGRIYVQNDPTAPGYNPNEEHALMIGGRAWALRDDLNITTQNGYSSAPFVLVDYFEADGRPAMRAFHVLREKPSSGILFDYVAEAGRILQAPMPLPLLPPPVEGTGASAVNYNVEPNPSAGDLPSGWNPSRDAAGPFAHYRSFTFRDRKESHWLYRGLHAGLPALAVGRYDTNSGAMATTNTAVAVVGQPFTHTLHATRRAEGLAVAFSGARPGWASISGLAVTGQPAAGDVGTNTVTLVVTSTEDGAVATNRLVLQVRSSGTVDAQGPLHIPSTNSYAGVAVEHVGRPPFLANPPTPTNSFTMRFYYRTEAGFAWPGVNDPPAVGSIVPYLRPRNGNAFVGDPAAKGTPSLDIVYRPVWPANTPVLRYGETLTDPKNGLAAVRGQTSAGLLYQQSIAKDTNRSRIAVVLADPTRQKVSDMEAAGLESLPAGIRTSSTGGRTFFPNLPPHLASRLYLDPARGTKGSLVFEGERIDEGVGEAYLLLNVLRGSDMDTVLAQCPAGDPDRDKWVALVEGLETDMETFREDPDVPGTYRPEASLTRKADAGTLPEVTDPDVAVDSYALSASGPGDGYVTLVFGNGRAFTPPGEPVSLAIFRVAGELYRGQLKPVPSLNPLNELFTLQHSADLGGRSGEFEYEWRIGRPVDGIPPAADAGMTAYRSLTNALDVPRFTLGGAGVDVLADNYVVLRYRPVNPAHPLHGQWSPWTDPQLVEGWIKRVLAGINPFNQRVSDLFNNQVNTEASLISQAGARWEGDVALSLENINEHGLIAIYETVLRRGRMLSVDAGINDPGANDALLLAAGYLNDLYSMLGNEAYADAADPTIGIGTRDRNYGDVATSLFSFKGQTASLMEEELALLRGRDDGVQPGVKVQPVYNRLFWNFTRGIDSGEVVYSLNYDIRENAADGADGVVNASDARRMFPQGHGDAYGHYLTAIKGYHELLFDADFEWVPRSEAVTVLGQAIQVDYMDERKFSAAAVSLARTGLQVVDLVWRQDIPPGTGVGWSRFAPVHVNTNVTPATERFWGLDHWTARTGQGAYLNWILGNAMLPSTDPDPTHEGIRKIDRTTVPELAELVTTGESVQYTMDSAEGGLTALGLPAGGIAFDIDPNQVVGTEGGTHYEQVERRAMAALSNAVSAFDDAKDVSRLMRSESDSLAELQEKIADQERAWENRLIELYGTPYTDDIGPGRTYRQGYAGPDLLHYQYVETPTSRPSEVSLRRRSTGDVSLEAREVRLDVQQISADWRTRLEGAINDIVPATGSTYASGTHYFALNVDAEGIPAKPDNWTGIRSSPGRIQQALSTLIQARARLMDALDDAEGAKEDLDQSISLFQNEVSVQSRILDLERDLLIAEQTLSSVQFAADIWERATESSKSVAQRQMEVIQESMPTMFIAGLAAGGDLTAPARGVVGQASAITTGVFEWAEFLRFFAVRGLEFGTETAGRWVTADDIAPLERGLERTAAVADLVGAINGLGDHFSIIDHRLRELDDARRAYRALVAEGERLQDERLALRRRSAALVQGFRTRDAAFRIFRSEKLERYKSVFDLAARYTYLAANAFDYETGLLGSDRGRQFLQRILKSRALGVVRDGRPQFAGSDTGDPGLSGVLAELSADWSALRGRLGLNNPDVYSTTASLRTGLHRILPGAEGDASWKDILAAARRDNILSDEDVRRHCLQLGAQNGLPVPGLIIEFSTVIAEGRNFFGRPLAAGDVAFSPSSYATKIFASGVAFEGYRGMDQPSANTGTVTGSGGVSPTDPSLTFLDPSALSATPYVYLIPAGVDSMRSPPIGDSSEIRSWNVHDVTVPLPFDIGGVEAALREVEIGSDTLSESLFAIRGHQAFRAVGSSTVFSQDLFGAGGRLIPSQFTNRRLIGRSAWNSRWKLVIPGSTLLNDPDEGLDRFLRTVKDVRVHFVTYSYSGN
jgi:hypothetical protein